MSELVNYLWGACAGTSGGPCNSMACAWCEARIMAEDALAARDAEIERLKAENNALTEAMSARRRSRQGRRARALVDALKEFDGRPLHPKEPA